MEATKIYGYIRVSTKEHASQHIFGLLWEHKTPTNSLNYTSTQEVLP